MWTKCRPFQHFGSHADQVRNCGPLFFTPCHENIISMYIIFLAFQNLCKEFQQVPRYPSYQAVLNHHGYHNCAVQCVKSFAQSAIWTIRPKGLSACSTQFTSPNSLSLGTLHCSAQLCWTESSDMCIYWTG